MSHKPYKRTVLVAVLFYWDGYICFRVRSVPAATECIPSAPQGTEFLGYIRNPRPHTLVMLADNLYSARDLDSVQGGPREENLGPRNVLGHGVAVR